MVSNALTLHRAARRLQALGVPLLPGVFTTLGVYLYRAWIHPGAQLEDGVELGYGGIGTAIAPGVRIGRGTFLSQQVTLGERPDAPGVPCLGRDVFIGAGAQVLGPVTVGDGASIGANAVVLEDVAPGAVVAGLPAKELRPAARTTARQAGDGVSSSIATEPG
jgi:serine O-acetyltransferase